MKNEEPIGGKALSVTSAIRISQIIATVPEWRLSMIREVLEMAGITIESLEAYEDAKQMQETNNTEFLRMFLRAATMGVNVSAGMYKVPAKEFNRQCTDWGARPSDIRRKIAALGLIKIIQSDKEEYVRRSCTTRIDGKAVKCVCIFEDWEKRLDRMIGKGESRKEGG